jgi:arylsulfatase A-like enzyme
MAARERWIVRPLLLWTVAFALVLGCGRAEAPAPPDVLLIVVDALRADHLGCYGYDRNTTPRIDRLAREAIRFENAVSTSSWTLPAVASLLTSQYPSALGIRDQPVRLDDRFPLLSELLREHGYATRGLVSHSLVSARLGFGRGFDAYHEESSSEHRAITSTAITQKAISVLRGDEKRPVFLFLHYFDPHYDYWLHEEHDFSAPYRGPLGSGESVPELWGRLDTLSPEDVAYLISLYDSEIAFTDRHIGAVLDELEAQDRFDDSVVIVTADHGEEFLERGWLGHSITLHQELIRVPLIIKLPGVGARVVETPVSLMDVAPSLLRYLGLDVPPGLDGRALDLASEAPVPSAPVFSETFNPQIHRPGRPKPVSLRSVVLGRRKLIFDGIRGDGAVYDLAEDPRERSDLSERSDSGEEQLEALLRDWMRRMSRKQRLGPAQDPGELFTPEQREQLEAETPIAVGLVQDPGHPDQHQGRALIRLCRDSQRRQARRRPGGVRSNA